MSAALEHEVLGQLILAPQLLEASDSLRTDLFTSADRRKAFEGISSIWADLRPAAIDPGILAAKTGLSPEFIAGLVNGNYRPDPVNFAWRVRELNRRRMSERILELAQHEGQHLVTTGEIDPAKLQEIREAFLKIEGLDSKGGFDPARVLMTGAQMKTLDLHVTWTLDKLIPERSLTVLHGPGGLGKTWLALAIVKAISEGVPFLGLQTKQCPVIYIDRENPWPTLVERSAELGLDLVRFWHLSFPTIPPKLDGPDWALYKQLPPGCFLVYDTARSCHDGKGNDDDVAALVMGHLKEIRELGQTILLLDHTPRANERISKGSGAWTDLADQVLAFYRMKPGTFVEIEEEGFDPNALLYFGTGNKTRFERFKLHLAFGASNGTFTLAEDPDISALDALADYIVGEGLGKKQGDIIGWAKGEGVGPTNRNSFIALLNRGEHEGRWKSYKGFRGAKIYEPTT